MHKFEIDISKITALKELVLDGYKPSVYNIGKAEQLEALVLIRLQKQRFERICRFVKFARFEAILQRNKIIRRHRKYD